MEETRVLRDRAAMRHGDDARPTNGGRSQQATAPAEQQARRDLLRLEAEEQINFRFVSVEAGDVLPTAEERLRHEETRARRGAQLAADVLFVLTHERFSAERAQRLWRRIRRHKRELARLLGRDPGVAVATMDYLANVAGTVARPTMIDEERLYLVADVATRDGMTGLYDHSAFQEALQREVRRHHRYGQPLSLLLLDLDHFKRYNDTHGHPAGDRLLERVGATVEREIRELDTGARYGGEEFAVIVPGVGSDGAVELAERLRRRIAGLGITASVGVATCPDDAESGSRLIQCADAALYRAKRQGRDRTVTRERTRTMVAIRRPAAGRA